MLLDVVLEYCYPSLVTDSPDGIEYYAGIGNSLFQILLIDNLFVPGELRRSPVSAEIPMTLDNESVVPQTL